MSPPCMCTQEVCAQFQGLCTSDADVDSSTNLAAMFMSHIFCAEVLCTSNTEKLNCDAGAGCSSSGVCRFYCKSFLRASRKSREMCWMDPITLCFAVEGAAWFYLSSPGCLCQRFEDYFALTHTTRHQCDRKKSQFPVVSFAPCHLASSSEGDTIAFPW